MGEVKFLKDGLEFNFRHKDFLRLWSWTQVIVLHSLYTAPVKVSLKFVNLFLHAS